MWNLTNPKVESSNLSWYDRTNRHALRRERRELQSGFSCDLNRKLLVNSGGRSVDAAVWSVTNQKLCLCFLMIKRRSVLSCLSGKVETRRISQTEDALPPPAFVSMNKPACIVAMKQHNLLSRRSQGNGLDRNRPNHPTMLILQELLIS